MLQFPDVPRDGRAPIALAFFTARFLPSPWPRPAAHGIRSAITARREAGWRGDVASGTTAHFSCKGSSYRPLIPRPTPFGAPAAHGARFGDHRQAAEREFARHSKVWEVLLPPLRLLLRCRWRFPLRRHPRTQSGSAISTGGAGFAGRHQDEDRLRLCRSERLGGAEFFGGLISGTFLLENQAEMIVRGG